MRTRNTNGVDFREPGDRRYYTVTTTPVGEMLLVGDGRSLTELQLPSFGPWNSLTSDYQRDDGLLSPVSKEIEAYFEGDLRTFSIPLAPSGTAFQLAVWRALLDIPYGETASYGEIAVNVGRPKAPRAVGMANHVNPIALIIPCHRVIGANGKLTGYGGGLPLKEALLELETEVVAKRPTSWDHHARRLHTVT
jgi:methylated-DNA-[protein]-cysteine S-methyltransferase